MITSEQFKKFAPFAKQDYTPFLNEAMATYNINTPTRVQQFMAQIGHESDQFKTLKEYASGKSYEGRRDLGNVNPGDGIKFKGRGGLMVTGRSNYRQLSLALYNDLRLLSTPELLEKPEHAFKASAWWWNNRGLNEIADKNTPDSFTKITKVINGGTTHLLRRMELWNKAKYIFTCVCS